MNGARNMRQLLIATVLGEERPQHLTRKGLEEPAVGETRAIATTAHLKRDEKQEARASQLDVQETNSVPKRATGVQKLMPVEVKERLELQNSSGKRVEVLAHLWPKMTYWRIDNAFIWVGKAQGKSVPLVSLPRLLDERAERTKLNKRVRRARKRGRQRSRRRRSVA